MAEPQNPERLTGPEDPTGEQLRQFTERLGAVEQRQDDLGSAVDSLTQEMSIRASQLADLDDRLRTVQRLLTEQRADLASERDLARDALGDEYMNLVTQHLLSVAQQLAHPDQSDNRLDTAQTVADLCRLLFRDLMPQPQEILDALGLDREHLGTQPVLQAEEAASTLRSRSASTPDYFRWDFAITPGSPLNSRQSAWANCAPDLPVRFVVAPAFLVNGKVIVPQLVYTSAEPPTLRPPMLLGQRPAAPLEDPAQDREQRKIPWLRRKKAATNNTQATEMAHGQLSDSQSRTRPIRPPAGSGALNWLVDRSSVDGNHYVEGKWNR